MSQNTRTASKPVKIILSILAGLIVLVIVIAVATSGGRSDAESKLLAGLKAVDAGLVVDEDGAIQKAKDVCYAPDQRPEPRLAFTRAKFGVDDPKAVAIVKTIRDSGICP
ncbi:hypothetical protein [Amycolatopsis sp. NPDC003731]